jgi:hypothetical protein
MKLVLNTIFLSLLAAGLFATVAIVPAEAHTVRCASNSKDRACHQASVQPSHQKRSVSSSAGLYAEVVSQKFEPFSANRGQWRGVVRGKGRVSLQLVILRNNKIIDRRLMGNVDLHTEDSTTYLFRSPLPQGAGWSSKVIAWSEPIRLRIL